MQDVFEMPPPRFFPYRTADESDPPLKWRPLVQRFCAEKCVTWDIPSGWVGFESCLICPDEWNTDFGGPTFAPPKRYDHRRIGRLALSVTMQNDVGYPVLATGYAYRSDGDLIGFLNLRYFGKDMARTLVFDVAEYRFPAATQFLIAFCISGGGSPRIHRPPLITSVALDIMLGESEKTIR